MSKDRKRNGRKKGQLVRPSAIADNRKGVSQSGGPLDYHH